MKRFLICLIILALLLCVAVSGAIEAKPTLPEAEPIITEIIPTEQSTDLT